jgi:short subunit dehydrogenase-like uncharacterized protein
MKRVPASDPLLIYGATGYTGRLIVDRALATGLRPILGGRDAPKLAALAEPLGLEHRTASLRQPERLLAALDGVEVLLNVAGPFSQTVRPLLDACLRAGVHYLDVTAEVAILESLAQRDAEAKSQGIMILPATGFDVVASDCLAVHVASRLRRARTLRLGLSGLAFATRGSAKTLVEHAGRGVHVRRDGAVITLDPGSLTHDFDFGSEPRPGANVSWGDVVTAYHSTGIPNIEVYFESTPALRAVLTAGRWMGWALQTAPWQALMKAQADLLPEGPTAEQRAGQEAIVVAEAEDTRGKRAVARLRTPEVYTFTALSASTIAKHTLAGRVETGFQTPARMYGSKLAFEIEGVRLEDLE